MIFDNQNKPTGIKRLYLASLNSLRALVWLLKNESAFKQEVLLLCVAFPFSFYLDISQLEQLLLVLSVVFVLFTEIINTAIEAVVDRVGLEIHPLSGLAKDLGSAAVLLSMLIASAIWLVILLP